MIDPDVLALCTSCLVGAALEIGDESELALSARALARDLADSHGRRARALLEAAAQEAIEHLDASTLQARDFAASLRRLHTVHSWARAGLESIAVSAQPA